mgnify:CR=1 FL=1
MIERYTRPQMGRIWSQENKLRKWLQVEVAVAEAWAELGRIPPDALEAIRRATYDLERWRLYEREMHHDFNAFLRTVADSLPPEAASYLHLGLTSYDVEDTALSLMIQEAAQLLVEDVDQLRQAIAQKAREHKYTVMAGRTHGVHAEPTTFGLKLALWWDDLGRHRQRLLSAKEEMAVGKISGPVGTHATVPPEVEEKVCTRLGLRPAPTSDQVLSRDRHAYFLATIALTGASLERFATEVRHLQRTEVQEVEEPFASGQTGSSAMPHKRNPEKCERICGLARLLRGYALAATENIPLWHERDISHSSVERVALPDACILLDYMLDLFTQVVEGMRVYPERMKANLHITCGLIFSQRVLLALMEKGLPRPVAYEIVQRNAMRAWEEGLPFRQLLGQDPQVSSLLRPEELDALFDLHYYLRYVDQIFRRVGL